VTYTVNIVYPSICAGQGACKLACRPEKSDVNSWASNVVDRFSAHVNLKREGEIRGYTTSYDVTGWIIIFVLVVILNFIVLLSVCEGHCCQEMF